MAEMTVAFVTAKCLKDTTVPGLGKCVPGNTYRLNHWQARGWAGDFDMKNAKIETEKVKMDDMSQDSVAATVAAKEASMREWLESVKNPPKKGTREKVVKPRDEVLKEMGAGKINDLLASYDLPKLPTKEENIELVLTYEKAHDAAKAADDAARAKLVKELDIVKPDEGAFDEVAAIAKAVALKTVDTEEVGEGNPRNQKTKDKQAREDKKGEGDKDGE